MRILQTVFQLVDYGGIVNYTELLTQGLQAHGHDVDVVLLHNSPHLMRTRAAQTTVVGAYKSSLANATFAHAAYGWYGIPVYHYGSPAARKEWRKFAAQYDVVIHQIPVPACDPDGNWLRVYDIKPPQLLVSHDAHFPRRYPHMLHIADKVIGIAAVNPASYASLAGFSVKRALIGSPHKLRKWSLQLPWHQRPLRFGSAHVWKKWKHMDTVLRTLRHCERLDVDNWIAGDGIEGRYMRSPTKCPERYAGLWRSATRHGMNYAGMVAPREIAEQYEQCRVMVDLSYSPQFSAEFGNHVNRSVLEAYNAGCVPLVVRENMTEPKSKPHFFEEGRTHLAVSKDATPKQIALAIRAACDMRLPDARAMVAEGRTLLKRFWSVEATATFYLEFIYGHRRVGMYRQTERGHPSRALRAAAMAATGREASGE
jgi:glycosyltransferase involved in cell wall biosynthesis